MRRRGSAAIAAALALLVACAGEEATRPSLPPPTSAPTFAEGARDGGATGFSRSENGDSTRIPDVPYDAAPPPKPPLPAPAYGAESPKPSDPHPFRLALALRALRGSPSAAHVLKTFGELAVLKEAKSRTGVDPLVDGEWLLVYGAQVAVPGANASVLKHGKPESTIGDPGPVELFGVRDVLLRPQLGVLALVPSDREHDLAAALAKPIDPGVKPGELARVYLLEPAKLLRMLPAEVVHATVIVKPASDGGFDASAEAECPDAAACKTIATNLEDFVRRQNGMLVRIVLGNVLGSFTATGEGAKVRATLHAKPEHVDAALNFLRSEIGLPAEARDAGAP